MQKFWGSCCILSRGRSWESGPNLRGIRLGKETVMGRGSNTLYIPKGISRELEMVNSVTRVLLRWIFLSCISFLSQLYGLTSFNVFSFSTNTCT